MELQIDNIQALLDKTRTPVIINDLSDVPVGFIPDGYTIASLEKYLPAPARKRCSLTFTDANSFAGYVGTHATPSSTLYASVDYEKSFAKIEAVIDEHGETPAWREHRATYLPRTTVEWRRWIDQNAKPVSQEAFAAFIEDNLGDIATAPGMPTGTEMLQMAQEFEATHDKRFRSKINLQGGGVHLVFIDEANKDSESRMRLFERFSLGIRPLMGGAAYRVDARLKYRNTNGTLFFWYELVRPDKVFEDAIKDELNKIATALERPVLYGTAD